MYSQSGEWDIISMPRFIDKIKRITSLRSFRARIFIVVFIVGLIPCIVLRESILYSYEARAISVRESEVQNQLKIIADHLITYNYLQDQSSEAVNAELEQLSNLYDGRVIIINGNFKIIKDTYGISVGKNIISEEVIRCFKGENATKYDKDNGFIEMTIPIIENISDEINGTETSIVRGVMLTSVATDTISITLDILGRTAWIIEVAMLVAVFVLAMLFSGMLAKPFNKVTDAINEVKSGYSDEALSVPDYKETEHIVEAFNKVLGRMRTIDQSRQEFVSNVSHELKTPITSIKLLAESLLMQDDVPQELYKEFMQDIVGEINREDTVIGDLLELVKLDKTNAELEVADYSINEIIERILKRLVPIARQTDIELVFESAREVAAQVDEVKLTLAFTNFVENAIKYNKEHGSVHVTLDCDHQNFTVKVSDTGIGIPEEAFDRIYERFYRVDKSHSREIGGTGLGLAIARNIVLMHRGTVDIESELDVGTTFTITIPLIYTGYKKE